jgi:ankyrin repeat protein
MAQDTPESTGLTTHAAAHPSIDAQDAEGYTALHRAAMRGDAQEVQQLLARGAKLDTQNQYGETPIYSAVLDGRTDCVRVLLEHGASPNAQDPYGNPLLWDAAIHGHTNCVQVLLEHGANPNAQGPEGQTALHLASQCGHTNCVQVLLAYVLARGNAEHAAQLSQPVAQLMAQPSNLDLADRVINLCPDPSASSYHSSDATQSDFTQTDRNVLALRSYLDTHVLPALDASYSYTTLAQSLRTCMEKLSESTSSTL